ncbi:MAG: hypothetical protein ACRD2U_07925 [Terriglobales bacterium]
MESGTVAAIAQMNLFIIFAVTVLAGLLGFALYRVAAGNLRALPHAGDPKPHIEPLDVLAFNNLIDSAEEDFLRENLPPPVFRSIQRLRLRAAIEYVTCASRNAALLVRAGKAVSPGAGDEQARQAQELVAAAVQLRWLSVLVLALLWVKIAFPALRLSLKEVSAMHERIVRQQGSLTRFKNAERLAELP